MIRLLKQWTRSLMGIGQSQSVLQTVERAKQQELIEELEQWDYPWNQFSLEDFVAWLEQRYGRSISVISFPMGSGVFGLWLRSDDREIFFHSSDLTGIHRVQAVLHEIAHWLLGHPTHHLAQEELQQLAAGESIPVPMVRIAFRQVRDHMDDVHEASAEAIAAFLLTRIMENESEVRNPRVRLYLDEMDFFQ